MIPISYQDQMRLKNSIDEIEQCETCDGTGVCIEQYYRSSDGYGEKEHECPDCDGTGRADDDTIDRRREEQAEEDGNDEEDEECAE